MKVKIYSVQMECEQGSVHLLCVANTKEEAVEILRKSSSKMMRTEGCEDESGYIDLSEIREIRGEVFIFDYDEGYLEKFE